MGHLRRRGGQEWDSFCEVVLVLMNRVETYFERLRSIQEEAANVKKDERSA